MVSYSCPIKPSIHFCCGSSFAIEVLWPLDFCLDIFPQYMGFREVRLINKGSNRHPICFVDYAIPAQAFLAMGTLQGDITPFGYIIFSLSCNGEGTEQYCPRKLA